MTLFQLVTRAGSASGVTAEMLIVFLATLGAVVLFVTEWLPVDMTAITIMATPVVLEPWTDISPAEGISRFSSSAAITILTILVPSAGVSYTGIVQIADRKISSFASESLNKQLLITVSVTGPVSGLTNNTLVVAILVPVISGVTHKRKTSSSKFLIPFSYTSQPGGMLALIGMLTSILASDTVARLSGEYPAFHTFDFFEFTILGIIVLLIDSACLLTIGHRLLSERMPVGEDYVEEYEIAGYLTEVVVRDHSSLVGQIVETATEEARTGVNILQLTRDGEQFTESLVYKQVRVGDTPPIRAGRDTLEQLTTADDPAIEGPVDTSEELGPEPNDNQSIVEVVIPSRSFLVGETLMSSTSRQCYDDNVPALRSRGEVIHDRMGEIKIQAGDTLLVQVGPDSTDRMTQNRDFVLGHEADEPNYRTNRIPYTIVTMFGVVGFVAILWAFLGNTLASLTGIEGLTTLVSLQQPILIATLGGVIVMVVTNVLKSSKPYDSIDWDVTSLLVGVIPLGIVFEQAGAAMPLRNLAATTVDFLPVLLVPWLFCIAAGLTTEVISNNTSVVLMIPVAATATTATNTNSSMLALAVTFVASMVFPGPVGYQTNLSVYGPGGYKFTDYFRVGVPLRLLLLTVMVLGVALFWGI